VGPFIGSKLGGAKSFFASSIAFLVTAAFVQLGMNETLPMDGRKTFKLSSVNPLAFLALLKDKTLAMLAGVAMLQSFGDYVNIYDINNLYMIKVLGYDPPQIGNVAMTVGLSQIAGGLATSKIVKGIGLKSHFLLANLAWALGCMVLGTARSTPKVFAAIAIWTFGHQRANTVNVNMQTIGNAAGMGRGEIIAASGNLLAYVKIMVPLLYSNVFAWATSSGRNTPGLPYFIIAALMAAAQAGYAVASPKE
jgi:Na+/melibiose symporter-like transporter